MEADDAARVGPFLSEVLNNAIEHGFGDGDEPTPDRDRIDQGGINEGRINEGRIDVRLDVGDRLMLRVTDNGRGLAGAQWPRRDSLGGLIVLDLVARLGGGLDVRGDGGTVVTLTMPRERDVDR